MLLIKTNEELCDDPPHPNRTVEVRTPRSSIRTLIFQSGLQITWQKKHKRLLLLLWSVRDPSAVSCQLTGLSGFWTTNCCCRLFSASPLMGAQSFPNLTTTGTTSTVTMSTSIVTCGNNVATATTGLSVGQLLSNTLTTSLTSTSSESDTGQEAEFSLYGLYTH